MPRLRNQAPAVPVAKTAATEPLKNESGHWLLKLGDPVRAGKLRRGMKVVISGEMVEVVKVCNPAHPEFPHMVLVNVRFPENTRRPQRDTSIAPRSEDLFYQRIVSRTREDEPSSGEGWDINLNDRTSKISEPSEFNPLGRRKASRKTQEPVRTKPASKSTGSDFSPRGRATAPAAGVTATKAGAGEIELRIADGLYEGLKECYDLESFNDQLQTKLGKEPSVREVLEEAVHKQWWHAVFSQRQALRLYSLLLFLSREVWPQQNKGAWVRACQRLIQEMQEKFDFSTPESFSKQGVAKKPSSSGSPSKKPSSGRTASSSSGRKIAPAPADPSNWFEEVEEIETLPARKARRRVKRAR